MTLMEKRRLAFTPMRFVLGSFASGYHFLRQTNQARLILSPRSFLFPRIGRQESVVNCPAPGYTWRRSEGNRWRQMCFT